MPTPLTTSADVAAMLVPELLAELIALRARFHSACRFAGSDEEFVLGSTPGADAAIAKATGITANWPEGE